MELHALPRLGRLPVNAVGREDVLSVLTPIWTDRPETARRVRRGIRQTLDWTIAHGHVENNVAADVIRGALPTMPSVKHHHRALPHGEVADALDIIEASRASNAVRACFRFLVLTASRSGEARGATWAEIDTERCLWTIPADRMKAANEHRVPLSDTALAVLVQARPLSGGEGLVFPSPMRAGQPMSDMTLIKLLRDNGLRDRCTIHGFWSSFRDWCADTGKPRKIAEAAVARQSGCEARDNQDAKVSRLSPMMTRWWGTWQGVFTAPSDVGWLAPHGLSSGFSRVAEASCVRSATSVFAGVAREAARPRPRLVCNAVRRR